ncbi:hypothetical protein [Knoellia subterranea]|uniref:hypothetical protein n=1 Tax=Knoellia subterranea TaxID=184882 RepID=UPI0012EC1A1F|nr:hypothetical protein [Knoellia subterranea]
MAEPKVREIVAQVEAHTRMTGEDPVEAFGQPVDYAAQWQPLSGRHLLTQFLLGVVLAAGIMGVIKAVSVDRAWADPTPVTFDDLPTFGVFVALLGVLPWTVDLFLSRRRASRLGQSAPGLEWPLRWAAILGIGAAVSGAVWILGEPSDGTLFMAPRWLLLALGLATLPILFLAGPHPGMDSHPRPPGPAGHEPSWKSRMRRTFLNR